MAGIKCPRLGLGETGIWREILMTSLWGTSDTSKIHQTLRNEIPSEMQQGRLANQEANGPAIYH